MTDSLLVDRTDAVVTLTLNRPDAMNALDVDLKEALRDTLASLESDRSCRAIVLAGAGKAFCPGSSLSLLKLEQEVDALRRELREELGIETATSCLAPIAFASHGYEKFHLLMPVFACRKWNGTPQPHEGQALKWVAPVELARYPMPPADLPLIGLLRDLL